MFAAGQPVAWAIADREDEIVLTAVFTAIQQRCPHGIIKTLMTDDCE